MGIGCVYIVHDVLLGGMAFQAGCSRKAASECESLGETAARTSVPRFRQSQALRSPKGGQQFSMKTPADVKASVTRARGMQQATRAVNFVVNRICAVPVVVLANDAREAKIT